MRRHWMACGVLLAVMAAAVSLLVTPTVRAQAAEVDFNRDIRPLLSANCFACHGQDESHREAGLRLDGRDTATHELESGAVAIVPGDPDKSEILRRITSDDDAERMPPPEAGRRLTDDQVQLIRRWIAQGAPYAQHWAFVAPARPKRPQVENPSWAQGPMDEFVLARLDHEGLAPAPPADRYTLIRRVSLDLRGLPPTPDEVDTFLYDAGPDAYERMVDRVLADPGYGERWARVWLDLARYADSRGYGSDPLRSNMWRYRDWVIDALNCNVPYDQFTIEQLAGDLLPDATLEQRIATAFHRNTMTNTEGGTDDEEFRVAAIQDRVDTTVQVWMGLTMGCSKCHNHKYDPISQREYFQFYAFFNQSADADRGDESPTIEAPAPEEIQAIKLHDETMAQLQEKLRTAQDQLAAESQSAAPPVAGSLRDPVSGRYVRVELPGQNKVLSLAELQVYSNTENLALKGKASQSSTAQDGRPELAIDGNTDGNFAQGKSTTHTNTEQSPRWEVDLGEMQSIDRLVIWNRTDGDFQSRLSHYRIVISDAARKTVWRADVEAFPNPSSDLVTLEPTAAGRAVLAIQDEIAAHEKARPAIPTLPIMQELAGDARRKTYRMVLANFLNPDRSEELQPAVPGAFHSFPADAPATRLGAARWLADPQNPLTARVAVNRFWSQLFGIGLVQTEEDFGTQGEPPSHPELLDWLAIEFMSSGAGSGAWDMKALLRRIVTSASYRQSSRVTPELLQKDPANRLLARGPRFRLEGEVLRDQALELAGLLSRTMRGPSVYPYQPDGLWRAAFNGERTWTTSVGEDRYRRGLYTFWRRTVPYPSLATFDAPSREICTVRRLRTNTPLQAFVLMNDPVYVEAAQALARRIVREGGQTVDERAQFALQLCQVRPPRADQIEQLTGLFHKTLDELRGDPESALHLATELLGPLPAGWDAAELAAWTVVANVVLNMDSVLAKG